MNEFGRKIKNFVEDHTPEIVCAALFVGGYMFYSKSFNYGFECGVNSEKARNSEALIMEMLKAKDE